MTAAQLAVWLHRTTVHVATDVWRSEIRRRNREYRANAMHTPGCEDAKAWEEVAPHLDKAINQLREAERQAILLRFFQRKSMRDLGQELRVSEAAAKMRVGRALDRLRSILLGKGITCGSAVLASLMFDRSHRCSRTTGESPNRRITASE